MEGALYSELLAPIEEEDLFGPGTSDVSLRDPLEHLAEEASEYLLFILRTAGVHTVHPQEGFEQVVTWWIRGKGPSWTAWRRRLRKIRAAWSVA